ncbi:MAG: restriction endonuclease [Planctomycetes bacterium]|nr:restriction endonuclease [Planctomycetota bacterium]
MKQKLSIKLLCREAGLFAEAESVHPEPTIYGVTDGKAVGTYLEHKFQAQLREKYRYVEGSSGNVLHSIFIEAGRTADYQTTRGILNIIENNGNEDDIVAFMQDRLLPVEEIGASQIAKEILANPPKIGYLTISNALQWRLQYKRVIAEAGRVDGIYRIQ